MELIYCRATCRILDMRSDVAYYLLRMMLLGLSIMAVHLKVPNEVRMFAIVPNSLFILPFALSMGPARKRIARILVIDLAYNLTEVLAIMFYSILSGGEMYPTAVDWETLPLVTLTYCLIIVVVPIILEVITRACGSHDEWVDHEFAWPLVLISLSTLAFVFLLLVRVETTVGIRGGAIGAGAVPLLAYSVISLALSMLGQAVMLRDAESRRLLADQAAATRQVKHLRSEIETIAMDTERMRLLGHDLSNQVGVVAELATSGRTAEANSYLYQLQANVGDVMERIR